MAQSTVSIYGRLDVGFNESKANAKEGATTATAKLRNVVNEDGLSTGLIGFRGVEDLGGGLKATFVHEMDLDMDTGTLGVGAGRDSTVGLEGGFGSIRLGRSYTPMFSVIGASDPFGTTGATVVNIYPTVNGVRVSNAFFYSTPSFGGLTANVMVADNKAQGAYSTTTGLPASTVSIAARSFGLSLRYASGPVLLAYGYGQDKGLSVDTATLVLSGPFLSSAQTTTIGTAVLNANAKYTGNALTATYDAGVAKVFFGYTAGKHTDGPNATLKVSETNLGVTVPMGAVTLIGAVGRNTAEYTNTSKLSGTDFAVGATYALSKRTTAYIKTGTFNKYSADDFSVKTSRSSIGVRHTF